MEESSLKSRQVWKADLEEAWRGIPKPFRAERSILRTLQCHLFNRMKEAGFHTVADYVPPRVQDRPVDLIALDDAGEIVYAVCFERVITLAAVKSLDSFAAARKVIFTTGSWEKRVEESRFFLKPDMHHIHLNPFAEEG